MKAHEWRPWEVSADDKGLGTFELVSGELLDGFGKLLLGDRQLCRRARGYGGVLSPSIYVKELRKFALDFNIWLVAQFGGALALGARRETNESPFST